MKDRRDFPTDEDKRREDSLLAAEICVAALLAILFVAGLVGLFL